MTELELSTQLDNLEATLAEDRKRAKDNLARAVAAEIRSTHYRLALEEIAGLDEPVSPSGALRQCDFLKRMARAALEEKGV